MRSRHKTELAIDVDVEFNISGKHIPATYYQPEEFPEIEIESVKYGDPAIEIIGSMSKDELDDLEKEIWDSLEGDED